MGRILAMLLLTHLVTAGDAQKFSDEDFAALQEIVAAARAKSARG